MSTDIIKFRLAVTEKQDPASPEIAKMSQRTFYHVFDEMPSDEQIMFQINKMTADMTIIHRVPDYYRMEQLLLDKKNADDFITENMLHSSSAIRPFLRHVLIRKQNI